MNRITGSTEITVCVADDEVDRCTWGEFARDNARAEDGFLEDVEEGLRARGEYVGGGGAAPVFEVRLGWSAPDDEAGRGDLQYDRQKDGFYGEEDF